MNNFPFERKNADLKTQINKEECAEMVGYTNCLNEWQCSNTSNVSVGNCKGAIATKHW